MGELTKLFNIGEDTERELISVGIATEEQLRAAGSKEAWRKLKTIDPSACIHRLYGLEGAIRGVKKSALPQDVKDDLKAFYKQETDAQ